MVRLGPGAIVLHVDRQREVTNAFRLLVRLGHGAGLLQSAADDRVTNAFRLLVRLGLIEKQDTIAGTMKKVTNAFRLLVRLGQQFPARCNEHGRIAGRKRLSAVGPFRT